MDFSKDSILGSFCQPANIVPITGLLEHSASQKMHSYDILQAPNSKALITALKTLQEKICRLELEKSQARDHLSILSREAAEYKRTLDAPGERQKPPQSESIPLTNDVVTQLNAAQQRCALLDKQQDYMRKMVQNVEMERNRETEQILLLQKKTQDKKAVHFQLEKVDLLQKECLRLASTHSSAESKIQQLEEKLCAEEHQRKLLQDKAAQLETGLEVNRILLSSASAQKVPSRKIKKKKPIKQTTVSKDPVRRDYPRARELPFVAGKSTSSSHSLSANVQTVLHMMKHHSPGVSQQHKCTKPKPLRHVPAGWTMPSSSVSSTGDGLTDILLALQDELGQMSFEHQELLKLINETENDDVREDLEREMDHLVKQMENKSDQILKLKRHQENVKMKKSIRPVKKQASAKPVAAESNNRALQATPGAKKGSLTRNTPTPKSKPSLQLLKNVQKIQMTLKKDDIMWEK
ncbi:centrosomal protein CEP57L1 [Pelodytes ibericus]